MAEPLLPDTEDRVERSEDLLCDRGVEAGQQIVRLIDVVGVFDVTHTVDPEPGCPIDAERQIERHRRALEAREPGRSGLEVPKAERGGAVDECEGIERDRGSDDRRHGVA